MNLNDALTFVFLGTILLNVGESSLVFFLSNETCIIKVEKQNITSTVLCQDGGNIVGLDVDVEAGFIFWSNNGEQWKGIYRAALNGSGVVNIVNDSLLVNGLVVDRLGRVLYWTDEDLNYISSCYYDGSLQRIVVYQDLTAPRGLVVDHCNGLLIWNDQSKHTIEMSRLDGSQRKNVSITNIILPNQMALVRLGNSSGKLFFVDAGDQTVKSILLSNLSDASLSTVGVHPVVTESSFQHILHPNSSLFGIAVNGSMIYVTIWKECSLISINLTNISYEIMLTGLGSEVLFSLVFLPDVGTPHNTSETSNGTSGNLNSNKQVTCVWSNNNNCSHICIPLGPLNSYRCACPTYGGLVIDDNGHNCADPSHVLVYADMHYGHIGWVDIIRNTSYQQDLHLIGRSSVPVGVAYDPKEKLVYWSDVKERRIYKRHFNASQSAAIFLGRSDFIGYVDGLILDYVRRNLYFTNYDDSVINGMKYSRHNIEIISLEGRVRRVIVTDLEEPRGLWIDFENKHLYYTDWGSRAKVVRSYLDGTEPLVILSKPVEKIKNPNSVVVSPSGDIFVIDSLAGKGTVLNDSSKYSILWQINKNLPLLPSSKEADKIYNWINTTMPSIKMPYGLSISRENSSIQHSFLFISDWGSSCVWKYDDLLKQLNCFLDSSVVRKPAGLLYFNATESYEVQDATCAFPCSSNTSVGMCLSSGNESRCYCPSLGNKVFSTHTNSCITPENFFLIDDMMSIRMVDAQSDVDRSVYDIVQGDGSNSFSAMAYQPDSHVLFYSDVNRGKIMLKIFPATNEDPQPKEFYNANQVIDDMLIHNNSLYWVANFAGQIVRLPLSSNFLNWTSPPEVVLAGLNMPKSLAVHKSLGHLYWACENTSQVWRFNLGNKTTFQFNVTSISKPGALFIDQSKDLLYILDKESGAVASCNLTIINESEACQVIANLTGRGIFYGLAVFGNTIFYSSWRYKALYSYNLINKKNKTIACNLVRPTRFLLHHPKNISDYCLGSACMSKCNPTIGGFFCSCPSNEILDIDAASCIPGNNLPANLRPYFIGCPQNINVYTTNENKTVWWKNPTLAGTSDDIPKNNLTVNIKPGSVFVSGTRIIRYLAYNSFGFKAECIFNVSIIKINNTGSSCPNIFSVINGEVSCMTNETPSSCKASCFPDFLPLFPDNFLQYSNFCNNPSQSNKSNTLFCARSSPQPTVKVLVLTFTGPCPGDSFSYFSSISFAFYSWSLCSDKSGVNYQGKSDLCNLENFVKLECRNSSGPPGRKKRQATNNDEVAAKMDLWETEDLKNHTSRLMLLIVNGLFVVDYNGQQVKATQLNEQTTDVGCPESTVQIDGKKCMSCPYGTKYTNGTCEACPAGTYQPRNGQSSCTPCPVPGSYSDPGSYDANQCIEKIIAPDSPSLNGSSRSNVPLIVGLVVGLGGGLLLVLLVLLLSCWYKKKKEEEKLERETRREFGIDNGYYADDYNGEQPVPLNSYRGNTEPDVNNEVDFTGNENRGYNSTVSI